MFDLYLITPERPGPVILSRARAALGAAPEGRVALQLRAKHLPAAEVLALAQELRELTRRTGSLLFINDRVDIALACAADGVHLPEQGLPLSAARAQLSACALIGVSCHDLAGLQRAAAGGATFATLAPVFQVPGKGPALGVARFAELARAAQLPVYALGGLTPEHFGALHAAGASGISLIREVFDAPDPALALRACLRAIDALKIARLKG